jgi:hypothetical protein
VPLRDHVWPKFLHDNAARVLGLPLLDAAVEPRQGVAGA